MKYIKQIIILCILLIFIYGCYEKTVCGNGIVEDGETEETCCEDVGCLGEQICLNHRCNDPECSECQYLQNHSCVNFECCENNDCKNNEICIENQCTPFNCGECQYIVNHQCKDYSCSNDSDCSSEMICENHQCVNYQCVEDSDCNYGKECFNNRCMNLICDWCEYVENHTCVNYECCKDSDCDDGEGDTYGKCYKGRTHNAYCNFTTIPEGACNEIISNFNNPNENRINVVFVGINFGYAEMFAKALETYVNENEKKYGHLLYYEPFKSNKDQFNFWYVNEIGTVENYLEGPFFTGIDAVSEIMKLSQYCNVENKYTIGIINWKFRSIADDNHVRISHDYSSTGTSFVHEFGHYFGSLADEYRFKGLNIDLGFGEIIPEQPTEENCDIASENVACPKWCSGKPIPVEDIENYECSGANRTSCMGMNTPCIWVPYGDPVHNYDGCLNRVELCRSILTEEECINSTNSYWSGNLCIWLNETYPSYNYFKSQCIPSYSGDINIGTDCIHDSGCYQVCGARNWFKSFPSSMMRSTGKKFGPVNEIILCKKIKNITGNVGGVCSSHYGIE